MMKKNERFYDVVIFVLGLFPPLLLYNVINVMIFHEMHSEACGLVSATHKYRNIFMTEKPFGKSSLAPFISSCVMDKSAWQHFCSMYFGSILPLNQFVSPKSLSNLCEYIFLLYWELQKEQILFFLNTKKQHEKVFCILL